MPQPLIEVSTTINAGAAKIWKTMTRRKSAMFMGAEVDSDWTVGHPITFRGEIKGKRFEDHGEIRTVEPEHELAFTHFSAMSGKPDKPENYNIVDYKLQADGSGTRVTLTQTPMGLETVSGEQKAQFEKNWKAMLDGLKKAAEAS